jgi:lipoprotein-releasing system ATP-binding protein
VAASDIAAVEAIGVRRVIPGPSPTTLVDGIDLRVPRGQFCVITGPSGSGKSSLLYVLGLLDRPTDGRVRLDGEETAALDSEALAQLRLTKLGFVFQFHFLLAEFSALENVALPLRRLGRDRDSAITARAMSLLEEFGLGAMARKLPDQLSGGERQRVALARALANRPLVVLADEPTGNLDSRNSELVFDLFARLAKAGQTIIAVTHDMGLAERADRQVRLVDGRIVSDEMRPVTG